MISVIIPAYNAATYIADAIHSVTTDVTPDCEIIVVNDHSSDDTAAVVTRLADADPRIRLVDSDGRGVTVARHTGVIQASGDWIMFMDADDTLPYGTLATLAKYADTDTDIVVGDITHIDGDSRRDTPYGIDGTGTQLFDNIIDTRTGFIWGKLIRRNLLLDMPLWPHDMSFCEDYIQMLQLSVMARRVRHCHRPTYCYHQRSESACNRLLTRQEYAERFGTLFDRLGDIADSGLYNPAQQARLHAMMLYYGRLYLWSVRHPDTSRQGRYRKLLNDRQSLADPIIAGRKYQLALRLTPVLRPLLSAAYIYIVRHRQHRIR